jgi:hypothetical protein
MIDTIHPRAEQGVMRPPITPAEVDAQPLGIGDP